MSEKFLLEMKNISKEFPGVKALDGVSLSVRAGTVHSLMGENGAGKSTLMKCLFGIYSKDSGKIFLDGKEVDFISPAHALRGGVAMVHQELNQCLKRNVLDNMWLGRYPKKFKFLVSEKKMYRDTKELFAKLNIKVPIRAVMSTLSVAERQMVEIAKAVSYGARVIVLDEPTSSLSDEEVGHLFSIIEMLKSQGCAIIYISHKMEEILKISDDITIMRDGVHITTERAEKFTMEKIINLMVGRELSGRFPERNTPIGEKILEVSGISSRHTHVKDVSFTLHKGEILGFAGLAGAGRTELLENLFGISERSDGRIKLHGKTVANRTPREAIKNRFALVTEERRASGIFGILNICENITISSLKKFRIFGIALDEKKRRRATVAEIEAMRIKTPSWRTQIRTLSGGNQQKAIIARWLMTLPEVLMLDEPTRGIDVGAKYEIYKLISELAKSGKTIIFVSSELPELLGVCDRICVMSGGELVGTVDAKNTTQEEILSLAAKNV